MNKKNKLLQLTHGDVLALLPALEAGVLLKVDYLDDEPLKLHKRNQFIVFTEGGTKVWVFDNLPDAWCKFTHREYECPVCKGSGLQSEAYPQVTCSFCGCFGKITEDQMLDFRFDKEFAEEV